MFEIKTKVELLIIKKVQKNVIGLTDVCPLLTKQYMKVGLQIQYMLYNF